jgi:hypothetical protein
VSFVQVVQMHKRGRPAQTPADSGAAAAALGLFSGAPSTTGPCVDVPVKESVHLDGAHIPDTRPPSTTATLPSSRGAEAVGRVLPSHVLCDCTAPDGEHEWGTASSRRSSFAGDPEGVRMGG